ncbi:unnamed protein product, partial [Staurois parvus]
SDRHRAPIAERRRRPPGGATGIGPQAGQQHRAPRRGNSASGPPAERRAPDPHMERQFSAWPSGGADAGRRPPGVERHVLGAPRRRCDRSSGPQALATAGTASSGKAVGSE